MLEKKTEHIKERIRMKKEEGEYKREENDTKQGRDLDFKREKKREIHYKESGRKSL